VALPYSVLALTLRNDGVPQVALPFLLATNLVAQLPLFGVTMMARSRKTASGIPYTVLLLPLYLLLSLTGFLQRYPIAVGGHIPWIDHAWPNPDLARLSPLV
jgi:uncharacterized membrane protein